MKAKAKPVKPKPVKAHAVAPAAPAKKKISVLIVDDHPVVRKGLVSCLSVAHSIHVVGEAGDGAEALLKVKELKPDVVLMDIFMPKVDGLAVTETMRTQAPESKVLVLSMQGNRENVLPIIRAGARGYVLKDTPPSELILAIETVHAGQAFFSPSVARIALNQFVSEVDDSDPLGRLSAREREVLVKIAEGYSNKEVASALEIGVRTIETHRERIMRKLNIRSVAGLTRFSIANGLVSLDGAYKH